MSAKRDRICVVARARKDAKLCFRSANNTQKVYDDKKFTPKEVRQNDAIPWQTTTIYHGGKWREVRYKEVTHVLWQRGTKQEELKLIVIAPIPYRLTKKGRLYYRDPAYLLCQATEISSAVLIQKYFDRWQIEVNHREEKDLLGVGQAQVRSKRSVPRQPAFVVAAYSALLLAGIKCYDDRRGEGFIPLLKWRRNAKRPSCLDLMQILRKEIGEKELPFGMKINISQVILRSAA